MFSTSDIIHYIYRFSICLQIDRYTNPHLSLCIIGMIYIPPHILIRGIYMMCDCSFLFHSKGWVVVEKWARLSEHTEYINTIHHTVLVVLTHIMCCKHSKNRSVWVCVEFVKWSSEENKTRSSLSTASQLFTNAFQEAFKVCVSPCYQMKDGFLLWPLSPHGPWYPLTAKPVVSGGGV